MIRKNVKIMIYVALLIAGLAIWISFRAQELSLYTLVRLTLVIVFAYVAMFFDISERRIPNGLVLGMFAAWALMIFVMLIYSSNEGAQALIDSAIGLLVGGGVFMAVYFLSGKGLGGGDVKFMAAAGLYLGMAQTIPAILYGTVLAAIVGFTLVALGKMTKKDTIPLAPFLFIGIAITTFTA